MLDCGKNGNPKRKHGNPNGSIGSNNPLHVQRIAGETLREYNPATSPRHLEQVKRYAELIGNYKKQGIKSPCDNKLNLVCNNRRFQGELADVEVTA